ncbi:MAG: amidohydrolase [Candidatus Bathyarchaeia archaeon]
MPRAKAVLLSSGRINRIFSDDRPRDISLKGLRVLDCKGNTLLPGFVDAHCHLQSFVESFLHIDLSPEAGIRSIVDIKEKIHEACSRTKDGTWIKARGYDEWYLEEKRHPTRFDLDEVSPLHPVKLSHRTGQVHVLNTLGLKMTGITSDTEDPEGGLIERDLETGLPTGLLFGMGGFLSCRIPAVEKEEFEKALKLATGKLLSMGITFLNDCTSHNDLRSLLRFDELKENGLIAPGLRVMVGLEAFEQGGIEESRIHSVSLGGVKILIHRASGRFSPEPERLIRGVEKVHKSGLQLAIHAIEEAEIALALEALEHATRKDPKPHRHRLEHCSLCSEKLLGRIRSLGPVVVSQPAFLYLNGDRYWETIPEPDRPSLYRLRSFLESGIRLAVGSDFPVGHPNPMLSIYACLSRKSRGGKLLEGSERIGLEQAVAIHTVCAAFACFEEQKRGSVEPGKAADLVLLNENIEGLSIEEIKDVTPKLTILGGEIVYGGVD